VRVVYKNEKIRQDIESADNRGRGAILQGAEFGWGRVQNTKHNSIINYIVSVRTLCFFAFFDVFFACFCEFFVKNLMKNSQI